MELRQSRSRTPWAHLIRDFLLVLHKGQDAILFIKEHKLWKGVNSYRWLSKALIFVGILFGLSFISALIDSVDFPESEQLGVAQAVGGMFSHLFGDMRELFLNGSMKYVILVLIEVVIFHFVRRTLIVVTNSDIDTSFKTFMAAQRRMILVVIYAWGMEIACSLVARIPFWFVSSDMLEEVVLFLIQAFFTGFVIVDNYNEVYHLSIKQSTQYAWQYAGITVPIGAMVFIILYIPFIGPIAGPLLGAVIATMALNAVYNVDKNMQWVRIPKRKRDRQRI